MEKLKYYLTNEYPYSGAASYTAALEELNASVASIGPAATKRYVSDTFGYTVVKLIDGSYSLQGISRKVYVDFKLAWVSKQQNVDEIQGYYNLGHYYKGIKLFTAIDQPYYNRYALSEWIQWGDLCEECGAAFIAEDGETLCNNCRMPNIPHAYNIKAEELLGYETTSETLFGIELEYEKVTAMEVNRTMKGHAIAKSDGSIRNGVEMVTRPACVKTHKEKLKSFYDKVKVKPEANTGMHVHVDKSKLSVYQIGFMMEFLNKPELVADVEKVAGRKYSTNTYCKTSPDRKMTWGNQFDETSYRMSKTRTDKYSPLNTAKRSTIEIRIFASPKDHQEMSARLDFVNALVKYSSPYSVSVKRLQDKFSWAVFTEFVLQNKKEFPDFYQTYLKG